MTYARARLWLGITSVGTLVSLSTLALVYQMGWTFFPFDGSLLGDAAALWVLYFAYVLLSFYFDYMGGYYLPCRFERLCVIFPVFLSKWLRGIAVQGTVMVASALLLLEAGKLGGLWASAAALLLLQGLLLALQLRLARMTGGLSVTGETPRSYASSFPEQPCPPAEVWAALDSGFSGGPGGLPGRETMVLPQHWNRSLPDEAIQAAWARRRGLLASGARTRGVLVALAWNTAGFVLSASLPGSGVTRVAELVQTIFGCALWSFLGLLLLPSLSRRGVFEADRWAHHHGVPFSSLYTLIREVDQLQEDEPVRRKWIERIFHPVPSVESRLRALESDHAVTGAWQAARLSLFLSWANFGLLSRAVHCNAGRPELWVMLPGD
jgi:hypothetical protein